MKKTIYILILIFPFNLYAGNRDDIRKYKVYKDFHIELTKDIEKLSNKLRDLFGIEHDAKYVVYNVSDKCPDIIKLRKSFNELQLDAKNMKEDSYALLIKRHSELSNSNNSEISQYSRENRQNLIEIWNSWIKRPFTRAGDKIDFKFKYNFCNRN